MRLRLLVLFICTGIFSVSYSQTIEEQMTRQQPDCRDVLFNASEVLPKLYAVKSFDSVQIAINIMQRYCNPEANEVVYLTTLLHIQQSAFTIYDISGNYRFNQLLYGYYVDTTHQGVTVYSRYYFPYDAFNSRLPQLIQTWAKDLLSKPGITATESFVCHVLAGDYKNPRAILRQHKEEYPELYTLLHEDDQKQRDAGSGVLNLMVGVWIPTGNLKMLGTHPSVGLQLGGRGKRNEYVLTMQARFIKAANFYTVRRQDSLYQLNYYFGGYFGFDYLHYFLHSTKFEAGTVVGVGYDGFDITASNSSSHDKDYLNPQTIGSVNVNGGLRFNYYVNPRLSLGIMVKYNAIWYKNRGGTSLRGQPVSIDFIIGR